MEEVLELIKGNFIEFDSSGISMAIYGIALLYLIAERKTYGEQGEKYVKYGILFFLLAASPFTGNDIIDFWLDDAYWKVFMMPVPVVCIAFAMTEFVRGRKKIFSQVVSVLACVLFVAVSRDFLFELKTVGMENPYKVSNEIVELDGIIRMAGIPVINMIAPRAVCAEIREIDAGVQLLYGEDLIENVIYRTAEAADESEQMNIERWMSVIAAPKVVENQIMVAEQYGSNCIILDIENDDPKIMEEAGYRCAGRTAAYAVYFLV